METSSKIIAQKQGTILLVDDEDFLLKVYKGMVSLWGFDAIMASDGQKAVQLFQEHSERIVCVLMDMMMPKMDGLATFVRLRAYKPDLKVILLSGYSEQEAKNIFSTQPVAGFLQKPFTVSQLKAALDRVLS